MAGGCLSGNACRDHLNTHILQNTADFVTHLHVRDLILAQHMSSRTNPLQKPPNLAFPTLGVIILTLSPSARWAFVPVGANEEEERSLEGVRNSDSAATCLES